MRDSSGKAIKKAGNNIISQTPKNRGKGSPKAKVPKKASNVILMRDNVSSPGTGLWCQKTNVDQPYESIIPKLNKENLSIDPEKEVDKKLIAQLKIQINDLTTQLQSQIAKCYDAEFRASRAENNLQTYIDQVKEKTSELTESESKSQSLESTVSSLTEALSNAKKEILRLNNELKTEIENSKILSQNIQNMMIEKERNNYQNSTEMNNLVQKIQTMTTEKENLMKIIQTKTLAENNMEIQNAQKTIDEKEKMLRAMETAMNKAINENAENKRRLTVEENNKYKLNEILKKKKEKISNLEEQLKGYQDYMNTYGNEVKWNQNQISQKDSQIKIIKDKLKQKDDLIAKLNKKIETLNKKLQEKQKDVENTKEKDNLVEVQAKPFLFGPEKGEEDEMFY